MAIAIDTTVDGGYNGGSTSSLSYSHTCTGANLALFVSVVTNNAINTISSVTYNSIGLTLLDSKLNVTAIVSTFLYGMIGPANGSNTVAITLSGNAAIQGCSASYTGVSQSGFPDNHTNNTASASTSVTTSLTVNTANSWLIMSCSNTVNNTASAGTGTFLRQNEAVGGGNSIFDSNGPVASGSQSLIANNGSSVSWGVAMASFAPVAATAVVGGSFLYKMI